MSKMKQSTGEDYPEAAKKHLRDAKELLKRSRYDGAAYLSGYVVECTLKTMIQVEIGSPKRTHKLSDLKGNVLSLAALSGAKTARYALPKGHWQLLSSRSGWNTLIRYSPAGSISQAKSKEWLKEADTIYNSVVVPMRLDGVI